MVLYNSELWEHDKLQSEEEQYNTNSVDRENKK